MFEFWTDNLVEIGLLLGAVGLFNYLFWYRAGFRTLQKWSKENGFELIESRFMKLRFNMGPFQDMWISKAPTFHIKVKEESSTKTRTGWFRAKYIFFVYSTKRTEIIWD